MNYVYLIYIFMKIFMKNGSALFDHFLFLIFLSLISQLYVNILIEMMKI